MKNPERLASSFNNIETQFMLVDSPISALHMRLSPTMEQKLFFILSGPNGLGLNKPVGWTFLNRFKKKYLNTLESQRLVPDIIRYICAIDVKSDATRKLQRFEVVKNLFLGIQSEYVVQQAKLALFYDWIYFNPAKGEVHRLEPAARLMKECAFKQKEMDITSSLVEFLYLLTKEYELQKQGQFLKRIRYAHGELVKKKVILTVSEYRVQDSVISNYLDQLFVGSMQLGTQSQVSFSSQNGQNVPNNQNSQNGNQGNGMDWTSSRSLPLHGSLENELSNILIKAIDSKTGESYRYFQQFLVKVCEGGHEWNPICIELVNSRTSSDIADYIDGKKNSKLASSFLEAIVDYQQVLSDSVASEHLILFCHSLSKENIMFGLALWTFLIKECAPNKDKFSILFWFFQGLQRLHDSPSMDLFFEYYFNVIFLQWTF